MKNKISKEKLMKKQKIKYWFWDKPIRTKLNLFFAMLIVVPLLLFGIVISLVIRNVQLEQIHKSADQYLNQSMQGIDNSLSELDNIVISNLWNQDLLKILNKSVYDKAASQEKSFVEDLLRSIANARKDIDCLVLVTESNEKFVYSTGGVYTEFSSQIQKDNTKWDESNDSRYQRGETVWKGLDKTTDHVMGVRKIRDFKTLDNLGMLYIFIKEESIRQQYEDLKITAGSFFVVQDTEGQVVSCDGKERSEVNSIKISYQNKWKTAHMEEKTYYFEEFSNSDIGWKVRQFTPKNEMMRDIYRVQLLFASVILIILGVLFLLMNSFSNSLTEPIRNLQEKMLEVRGGNFEVLVPVEHKDEMGELSETFNAMTERINRLIEEDYKSKILIQETEYKFLRAQINPHFLYNTLDAISWMASMGGNKDVSKMSVALGRILRWSISNTENIVTLREEVSNVEDYLSIQRIRYGDSLNYIIAVEEPELDMSVPKMILQPLVENALVHGLELIDGEKKLLMKASSDEESLQISIIDNGVGMTADRISEVMKDNGLYKKQHGVGLLNVHKRIQMNYGDAYGIDIKSIPGKGTEISILIPREKEWQKDDSSNDR